MSTAPADPPMVTTNPTTFEGTSFLLNAPFSYSTEVANNAWMEELDAADRRPDPSRAMAQFLSLYRFLASEGLVYLLPTPQSEALQDLVFTANLGIVLDHLPDRNTVVLANFTSPPRIGETRVGRDFFEQMGYRVVVPEARFEGEAELKHLHDNVYIGGYGLRSQYEVYDWFESEFDMDVVKVELTNPYLYHLDCAIFPVTRQQTMVCTEAFTADEIKAIEKYTEIVDVPLEAGLYGACNSVRVHNTILNASNIHDMSRSDELYPAELAKNRLLEDVASRGGFELGLVNLGEYTKGGALLSCMVMHLNRYSYEFSLL